MKRRTFLVSAAGSALVSGLSIPAGSQNVGGTLPKELRADVVIIGGGTGGCAAALGALRNGATVIMTEETDWIGGQLTQQGVPPDEHPWIEQFGCTAAYREYRNRVRDYYRNNYPLSQSAREQRYLNPGNGGVSRICHEPRVSLAVIGDMLAPYISSGQLRILLKHIPTKADVNGDRVLAVSVKSLETANLTLLYANYFLDATETGELLPLTGTEYVTGAEAQGRTGEMHAPSEPQPQNMQACTWCFAVDYIEGEDHTIEKPDMYGFWRDYVPDLEPAWPGKQLSWSYSKPNTLQPNELYCDPVLESKGEYSGFWRYRRIAYQDNFTEGAYRSDITLVNWPQNDYWLGNLYEITEEERQKHLHGAMQLSLSLLYWMQTEAPRKSGGTGFKGLRLRGDLLGTEHGLAKYPYIRESRRIEAEFTVLEEHVGVEMRNGLDRAEPFSDSVGVGAYRIDLHPSTGGDNYIDVGSHPFQIPLGALVPKRMENLIPACKNLGVTHITNGCYRLHPVEWNIGEAAGALAAYCIAQKETPRGVRNTEAHLRAFQNRLTAQGVELDWASIRRL